MLEPTVDIILHTLHPGQVDVSLTAKRFNVLACGRRWGKTLFGIDRAVDTSIEGEPVGWFAPTYKLMLEAWRETCRIIKPATARSNSTERRVELHGGGLIEFWSLDDPDAGRGRMYARVIIDEAAMIRHLGEAWDAAIRPTLADLQGDAWLLSTPKGHNFFWQCFLKGMDPKESEWAAWKMPTSTNPHISGEEIEAMRRQMPDRIFRQEILAEFIEDGGGVFRRVLDAAISRPMEKGAENRRYLYGVDWGKLNDFTVITVIDELEDSRGRVVFQDRFNMIDYAVQTSRLEALCSRFPPQRIVAERNAMGEPIIEQLNRMGLPVDPFVTTNQSKGQIIDGLALAFERGDLELLDPTQDETGAVTVAELQAYEAERLPSGTFRYGAPEGFHDDTVMSLAMAWHARGTALDWVIM